MSRAKNRSEARRRMRNRLRLQGWPEDRIEKYVWDWEHKVAEHYEVGVPLAPLPTIETRPWIARRRARLMARDPHCHYCGREVIYYLLKRGEKTPPDFATIDHVYSRIVGRPAKGETVLCCHECNGERSRVECAALSKEELWERSQCRPMEMRNV